ncbi:ABC transporter ATP-binding protein [Spirillospora sp. CA-255316]
MRVRLAAAVALGVAASFLGLAIPLVLKWVVDGPIADGRPSSVWLAGGTLLLLGAAEAGLFGVRRWLVARPLATVEATLRREMFEHLQRLPVSFHDRHSSGQLLSRAIGDVALLRTFVEVPLTFLLVNGMTILAGGGVLLWLQWVLGLVMLASVLPLVVLCRLFETRHAVAARQAQDQAGDLTTVVHESVLGIGVIQGLGRHRARAETFRGHASRLRGTELHKARLLARLQASITSVPDLALGAMLVVGAAQVAEGSLSMGTLVAFLATAMALRAPVESIGALLAAGNEAAAAADRCFEILDQPPPPVASRGRPAPYPGRGHRRQEGAELALEAVGFRYSGVAPQTPATLRGVDLRIAAGESVALVGATGSGKSTLAALIPRLHEPTEGRILLDGTDITDLDHAQLRAQVAVAFQEPWLSSATIADNVLMGAGSADGADLWWALRTAQADAFVAALADGDQTRVGEQGLRLSGGQRQRLALARAVIGRPRLLVLDDPLSALDIDTEALVEQALRQVLATTTALVVAHRPSTALLADRVALLSAGQITATGTHQDLLRTSAEYCALMSHHQATGPR